MFSNKTTDLKMPTKKNIKKEESKVAVGIAVKDGRVKLSTRWENANISDLAITVSYLDIMKNQLLGIIGNLTKKSSNGEKEPEK